MQSPIERDVSVNLLLTDLYTTVLSTEELPGEKIFADTLDRIFQHHAYGFRELLLVVFVSMELNPDYRATQDFYASKPRSLYELPIRGFLRANQMPHRKSGPLNMAKATQALNETWASRKKDSETAMTVVRLIQTLENDTSENFDCRKNFGLALMRAYVKSKRTVSNLSINCIPNSDPVILHQLCVALIDTVPDGGNTPQRIAALLLEEFHKGWQTGVTVDGSDDSANTTNTTSKKPGDIIESKGPHSKIYEVTVKRFDKNRLEDSWDSIMAYSKDSNVDFNEVIVLCRPQDCPSEMTPLKQHAVLGTISFNGLNYYFWNIYEWICLTLQQSTNDARSSFYSALSSYIDHYNTPIKVKKQWAQLQLEFIQPNTPGT